MSNNLLEMIAEMCHDQWSDWTRYLLDNMTEENIKRWRRQMDTPYEKLSEEDKDKDRVFARKFIAKFVEREQGSQKNGS